MIRIACVTALTAIFVLPFPEQACSQTTPRAGAQQPAAPAARQPLSPRLRQILLTWAQKTQNIQKLEGNHTRVVYNNVFKVEKRAQGEFYYEAPDKGRIDVSAVKVAEGTKGRPGFTVQSDLPNRWVCDGARVMRLDDVRKVATILNIPPEGRGSHIMDGPLPFLFGMPADKAQSRYHFELLKETADEVWLQVFPKTRTDAMNWKEAKVILMKTTFLPRAVQLLDPTGNRTTVYQFNSLEINKEENRFKKWIGGVNPFQPDLKGYQAVMPDAPKQPVADRAKVTPRSPANPPTEAPVKQATMPKLTNYHWKIVKERFESAGYAVKIFQGKAAPDDKLTFCVYAQSPMPGEALEKGQTVKITLYDRTVTQTSAAKPVRNE